MALQVPSEIHIRLQGGPNNSYSGLMIMGNVSFILAKTPKGGSVSKPYDHSGAAYFVIAVVLVYGLSIVLLIASHIKRRHEKSIEDRQISKYLEAAPSLKEKSARDSYRNLKKSFIPLTLAIVAPESMNRLPTIMEATVSTGRQSAMHSPCNTPADTPIPTPQRSPRASPRHSLQPRVSLPTDGMYLQVKNTRDTNSPAATVGSWSSWSPDGDTGLQLFDREQNNNQRHMHNPSETSGIDMCSISTELPEGQQELTSSAFLCGYNIDMDDSVCHSISSCDDDTESLEEEPLAKDEIVWIPRQTGTREPLLSPTTD